MPELESIALDAASSANLTAPQKIYHPGYEGVKLLLGVENDHKNKLLSLDARQRDISLTLGELKEQLKRCQKHLKSDTKEVNLAPHKETIMRLWNEWKDELRAKNSRELNDLSTNLDDLDFSNLSAENLDDKLIPELEKIQRHHEYKYQQIPNELRLFIELFTITVEILKDVPKKFQEVNSHISRNTTKG